MAIDLIDTIGYVAAKTKRVPQAVLDHFARELTRWVNEKCDTNQTRAAKLLGVSQGHISAMMNGTRGPGLNAILALRAQTGLSIDELLGLGPPPAEAMIARFEASLGLEVARFRAEATRTLEEARTSAAKALPERPAISRKRRASK